MFLRAGAVRAARRWGIVLPYSTEFGSAPVEKATSDEAALYYEENHRIKGGELGVAYKRNAMQAAPEIVIAAEAGDGTVLPLVDGPTVEQRGAAPVFLRVPNVGHDETTYSLPTTRFAVGHRILAVGHNAQEGVANISPGCIVTESDDEATFTVNSTPLGPGSFIVDMAMPHRLCGVVVNDGSILSTKDPLFIVNWVAHVLPSLVVESATRYPPPILQYINDTKRTIVRNQSAIPSMDICQKIFVKNSIEDFKYFML